jgi:hypothetical protein
MTKNFIALAKFAVVPGIVLAFGGPAFSEDKPGQNTKPGPGVSTLQEKKVTLPPGSNSSDDNKCRNGHWGGKDKNQWICD